MMIWHDNNYLDPAAAYLHHYYSHSTINNNNNNSNINGKPQTYSNNYPSNQVWHSMEQRRPPSDCSSSLSSPEISPKQPEILPTADSSVLTNSSYDTFSSGDSADNEFDNDVDADSFDSAEKDVEFYPTVARQHRKTISFKEIVSKFEKPIKIAAAELDTSLTQLKRLCREFGIIRWPYRKLASITRKIEILTVVGTGDNNASSNKINNKVDQLNAEKEAIKRSSCRKGVWDRYMMAADAHPAAPAPAPLSSPSFSIIITNTNNNNVVSSKPTQSSPTPDQSRSSGRFMSSPGSGGGGAGETSIDKKRSRSPVWMSHCPTTEVNNSSSSNSSGKLVVVGSTSRITSDFGGGHRIPAHTTYDDDSSHHSCPSFSRSISSTRYSPVGAVTDNDDDADAQGKRRKLGRCSIEFLVNSNNSDLDHHPGSHLDTPFNFNQTTTTTTTTTSLFASNFSPFRHNNPTSELTSTTFGRALPSSASLLLPSLPQLHTTTGTTMLRQSAFHRPK